ncbi:MAG: hypothetical protein WAW69_15280 [Polaromonas sp.]
MSLLGKSAIAMWWDMAPEYRDEFEDWHSHEHFHERLGIPGFLRGSRWSNATGGNGFFVMYELEEYETLTSSHYLASLNAPTPWSTKMMPYHSNMVRSQCRVLESHGGGIARLALTLRLSPQQGLAEKLGSDLRRVSQEIRNRPGFTAGHLLQAQTPALAFTVEQKIRDRGDGTADWIFIVCGYDQSAMEKLRESVLNQDSLVRAGASHAQISAIYTLSHSIVPGDIA